jgi:hypothetical protein
MKKFIRNNSLTIAFLLLFFLSLCFQIGAGFKDGAAPVPFSQYLTSGHLISSTFENWESEFLQMALFVILTIFLFQKGSSESKDPDSKEQEEVDKEPDPNKKDAPWPVKRGGVWLSLYKHSLTISLLLLFLLSFAIHFYGSLKDENEELLLKHEPPETAASYFTNARFWFESMQNWQSEFLSVFAIVMLSVYLRQKGSPQSKPVDAPHMETGG